MVTIEQFKIKPNGFNEIRKAVLIKIIVFSLIAGFGGLAIYYFNMNGQHVLNAYSIGFIIVVLTYGLYRGINKQKLIFDTFKLTLDTNSITREQHNTPIISIPYSEITEIIKNSNGSFTIKGKSNLDIIFVPLQIEQYEKFERALTEIRKISVNTSEPFLQKFSGFIPILTLGLMAIIYISENKIIVGVCGMILLLWLLYSLYEIQKNKNINNKTKKGMWFVLFVIASIIGTMYFKLTSL